MYERERVSVVLLDSVIQILYFDSVLFEIDLRERSLSELVRLVAIVTTPGRS